MPNGKKLTLTFTVDEARMIADALGTSLQEIGGSILSLRKVPSEDETVKCLRTTQKAITDFRERFDNAVTEAEGRRTVICSKYGRGSSTRLPLLARKRNARLMASLAPLVIKN